ncbi:hypothetical protein PCASD_08044 [Puccinia coronata f. sp. avenae]|uniref:Meiotic nuclear division protein 1 n=2 Tax=Puccinia coronata f. sp. avenae TaxID=200324 RepID=A0A2N5UZH3_9BASI|nr:hypothetical protein PCASD_08044 [Puccinia coronata f. sp. avenae]
MSKRGLSSEEKQKRTLEFFHENDSFFTLKDLTKLIPKAKGVVAQSVEETLKSLIDDGLVHVEKVGTVNLFWSFSSEASLATSRALTQLRTERDRLESENAELQKALQKSAADRLVNEERENNLREIKVLRQDISDMKSKLKMHSNNDPEILAEKMRLCQLYKNGAEVWTENLSMMMSYCRNEYQLDREKFCSQFELSDDFEEALDKI